VSARYWSRQRKFTRTQRAVTLHFTRHPGDSVIRVALANRPAHDIILLPPGVTNAGMYHLVRGYAKDLTRHELHHLTKGVGTPTPTNQ
jgi:hypothetical protein